MRKTAVFITVTALLFSTFLAGCTSLSASEKETLSELRSYGVSDTEVERKSTGTAGVLNILPGFGNFYLAYGTDEGAHWAIGIVNLLLWPISIVWGIPEAAIDAETINKKETVKYYVFDEEGKAKFEQLKKEYAK